MRKWIAMALIACLAMAVPMADGAAGAKRYKGSFEPGGTLRFAVKKRSDGERRIVRFRWTGFPVNCGGVPKTTSGFLRFTLPVNRRDRFRANAIRGDADDPEASLRLRGKLKGRRRALGTMKVEGSEVPVDPDGTGACVSPRTGWQAKRV